VESFFSTALLEPLKINQSMISQRSGEVFWPPPLFDTHQAMIRQRRSPPSSKTRLSMALKVEASADGSTPLE
jgi:hypothetical protein